MGTQLRQGDVLFEAAGRLSAVLQRREHGVLYAGESTGHEHRLRDPGSADVLVLLGDASGQIYLEVHEGGADIVHEEHRPIHLDPGFYRVWRQREYTAGGVRGIQD